VGDGRDLCELAREVRIAMERRLRAGDQYLTIPMMGMFIPSAGGKWVIEAPYVMQTANALHYPLGWAVQIYNAAEALPNLINPFWMLPLLGILGLKARDLIGFTALQFVIHVPLVLLLLWALGETLPYHLPVMPH